MSKVKAKVPRGFTRFYVLYLLTKKPMTGKEIIEEAKKHSEGDWTPSPGLIYPLLGRLLKDGLITKVKEGFIITEEGMKVLKQYSKLQEQIDYQFQLINKLGISVYTAGKFLAEETIDRINSFNTILRGRVIRRSGEVQEKFDKMYEEFLRKELERLNKKAKKTNEYD